PLVIAASIAAWALVGMDGAASIAEEVKDPSRNVPKAMVWSVVAVGLTIAYAALAILLAIPDYDAAPKGDESTNSPITWLLEAHWPSWLVNLSILVFLSAFITCMLTVQTVASRIVWAYARDGDLPFSKKLYSLTPHSAMPRNA